MMESYWPSHELERLDKCPICQCADRRTLYRDLTDETSGIAPGTWMLHQCVKCGAAFLDPRPNPESILDAYADYVTHEFADQPVIRRTGWFKSLLHDSVNGYLNAKYGLSCQPERPIGRLLVPLLPPLRSAAVAHVRHLRRPDDTARRLLDIGCGNGGFLVLATEMGWVSEGLDFDPAAVQVARARGVDARCGGIQLLAAESEEYDVITISHVIEHLHDPIEMLHSIKRLLKPGGRLWIETPNISSFGHSWFGKHWRGLEAPRHLVLFSPNSLRYALQAAGFNSVRQEWRGLSGANIFATSEKLRRCAEHSKKRFGTKVMGAILEASEMFLPDRRAFLTFTASKVAN